MLLRIELSLGSFEDAINPFLISKDNRLFTVQINPHLRLMLTFLRKIC